MKTPRLSDERGIALAVAVLALVVIGALVAGSFYAGRVEQRSGQNTLYAAQAFEAADAGASAALSTWSPTALNSRPIGADTVLPTVTSLGGGNAYTPTITRLSSNTFMVEWPRGSGKLQEYPEVDRGAWFSLDEARQRILPAQAPLLDALHALVGETRPT